MKKYNYDINKYPAHTSKEYKYTPARDWYAVLMGGAKWALALSLVLLVVGVPAYILSAKKNAPAVAVAGVRNGYTGVPILHTNTAEPSATPEPTHTRYPTITHTPTNSATPAPNIVYVEVTRIVVEVEQVERIITATPRPATRTPRPTATLTATEDLAPQFAALELSRAKRENVIRWTGFWASSIFLCGVLLLFVFAFIKAVYLELIPKRPTLEDTTQTADEIMQDMSPVSGITPNELRQIRLLRIQGKSQADMERVVSRMRGHEYVGGAIHGQIKAAIEYLDATTSPPLEDYHGEVVA